ncbi:MAG: sensor histidine kinase, partial [Bacteroidota bacterium]
SRIDFETYTKNLMNIISSSYHYEEKDIEVELDIDHIQMNVNQGIPCGLILNELVSNSYEHAFKGRNEGRIKVSLKQEEEYIEMEVSDDGIGFPREFDIRQSKSLGMTLVHTLTHQLSGELKQSNRVGTTFSVVFKAAEEE